MGTLPSRGCADRGGSSRPAAMTKINEPSFSVPTMNAAFSVPRAALHPRARLAGVEGRLTSVTEPRQLFSPGGAGRGGSPTTVSARGAPALTSQHTHRLGVIAPREPSGAGSCTFLLAPLLRYRPVSRTYCANPTCAVFPCRIASETRPASSCLPRLMG